MMVNIYGIVKENGFCPGATDTKIFITNCTRDYACKIMMNDAFIEGWNANHIVPIYKVIFEIEEVTTDD